MKIARVWGIQIKMDLSFLFILLLATYSVDTSYFPRFCPEVVPWQRLFLAIICALLLGVSVIVHELSHCLVAARHGIKTKEIALFLFGGAAVIESEPRTAREEFQIGIVGPITSALIAAISLLLGVKISLAAIFAVCLYIGTINTALALFNLLPMFPTDGGRAFKAIVWWRTGDEAKSMRAASVSGRMFSAAIMVLGFVSILCGDIVSGIWLILIGLFIRSNVEMAYKRFQEKQQLLSSDSAEPRIA